MGNAITPQFIGHELSRLPIMRPHQALEETLSSSPIPFGLKIDVDRFAILINSPPQVMLLAVDPDENFIDKECIAIPSVFTLQTATKNGTELDTPETD